ncbi:MAG: nicotinate-nicotinamide nucleotide adenylyltransferase [Polyangiaceae bacterium]|nr:nicotinate-nicotinamide nucleotide adenylyltransferase [Polyangiaceae bacterium]
MTTVAIFGGSFNPPHVAHVMIASFVVMTETVVDELWVVPCFQHPFAKTLAPFDDRLAMCRLAFSWIPRVVISTIERDLGGASRTIRTLRHIQKINSSWRLRMVIGTDIAEEAHRWDSFDEIQRLAPPIVLSRQGFSGSASGDSVIPSISSTQIREAMARGDEDLVRAMVPPAVLAHMLDRSLYMSETGGSSS